MWHLQVFQKHSDLLDFSFLFHTLDDVSNYVLNASQMFDYRLTFIQIWDPVQSQQAVKPEGMAETPFQFPEPLSAE